MISVEILLLGTNLLGLQLVCEVSLWYWGVSSLGTLGQTKETLKGQAKECDASEQG